MVQQIYFQMYLAKFRYFNQTIFSVFRILRLLFQIKKSYTDANCSMFFFQLIQSVELSDNRISDNSFE